jgi:hypothetical protein
MGSVEVGAVCVKTAFQISSLINMLRMKILQPFGQGELWMCGK